MRILLADDAALLREGLAGLLAAAGHEGGRRSGCDRLMRGADRPWTAAAHFSYEGMVRG